jgi:hypothetical protein
LAPAHDVVEEMIIAFLIVCEPRVEDVVIAPVLVFLDFAELELGVIALELPLVLVLVPTGVIPVFMTRGL